MFRFLLVIISVTTLQSCSIIIHRQTTNKLEYGLAKEEVVKIIGSAPSEKKYFGNKEVMVYYLHSSVFDLIFSNKFPYIGFYPFNITGDEFWIVLKNGIVVSFGYAKNYGYLFNNLKE